MQWCNWLCCQHPVMLIPAPLVSIDYKCLVAPHFSCLDQRNVVVPLTMLLALCDTKTSASGITWPKKSYCTSFGSSGANKCTCVSYYAIITWCQCQHQMHHMTKKVMCCTLFCLFTEQMQWCYWWCHWHDMMLILVPTASHDQKSYVATPLIILP